MAGHSGYYGCFVCEIEGEHMEHRMVFPQTNAANWKERDQNDIEFCSIMACFWSKNNCFISKYDNFYSKTINIYHSYCKFVLNISGNRKKEATRVKQSFTNWLVITLTISLDLSSIQCTKFSLVLSTRSPSCGSTPNSRQTNGMFPITCRKSTAIFLNSEFLMTLAGNQGLWKRTWLISKVTLIIFSTFLIEFDQKSIIFG